MSVGSNICPLGLRICPLGLGIRPLVCLFAAFFFQVSSYLLIPALACLKKRLGIFSGGLTPSLTGDRVITGTPI